MQITRSNSSHRRAASRRLWLRSHLASIRVLVAGREVQKFYRKYDPNQPRVPAGQSEGGRWAATDNGGGNDSSGDNAPSNDTPSARLRTDVFTDTSGIAPWFEFANTYTPDGALAAQLVNNRDDTTITTEWNTAGVADWSVRQTLTDDDQQTVTQTTLNPDGTGQITIGEGGAGMLMLAANDQGQVALEPTPNVAGAGILLPAVGDVVEPLTLGAIRFAPAALGAGGAFIIVAGAGLVASTTSAGGDSSQYLSNDVRLTLSDNGQLPVVQERGDPSWTDTFTGGSWRTLPGVDVMPGPGGALFVNNAQLQSALSPERFAAIGSDGPGAPIAMAPIPVASQDIPGGSIFAGTSSASGVYMVPGTVVDWNHPAATADENQQTVLEMQGDSVRGLSWTNGQAMPMIGAIARTDVSNSCPMYQPVYDLAIQTDAQVRAANPGLTPQQLGILIHTTIAGIVQTRRARWHQSNHRMHLRSQNGEQQHECESNASILG